jgi:hypothetical protein
MAVPILIHGAECWAMNKADKRAPEAAEMKCLQYVAVYIHKDKIHNDKIWQKFKIFNLNNRIQQNKNNWYGHILHTHPRKITQQIL